MNNRFEYTIVDGIKCYHPDRAESFDGYPCSGFDTTDDVGQDSFWVASRIRMLKREVTRAVGGVTGARFFEIGCGTGALLAALSSEPGMRLLGSEISLRGLRSARRHCPSVELIQMNAAAIPFIEEFDAIGAFDVIEHIKDDMTVLQGICKALKPSGQLVLTVPQHRFMWSSLDEFVQHQRRYSRRDLLRKLDSTGFNVTYVEAVEKPLFAQQSPSRMARFPSRHLHFFGCLFAPPWRQR